MLNNNSLTMGEFIWEYLYWEIIMVIFYNRLFFRYISGLDYSASRFVYWLLIIVSFLLGLIMYAKRNRTAMSNYACAIMPLGIYTALAYREYYGGAVIVLTAAAAVLAVLLAVIVFGRKPKIKRGVRRLKAIRRSNYLYGVHSICAVMATLLLLPMTVKVMFGFPLYSAKTDSVSGTADNTYTISNNIVTLANLKQESWQTLDIEERLEVLQTVANIEARYLGLSTELRVTASNLPEYVLGQYDDAKNQITLNMEHLLHERAEIVLETVCHEAYHSYEHRLTELYNGLNEKQKKLQLFNDAEQYNREFSDYKRGEGYFVQKVEVDSRDYAEKAVRDYYSRIEKYFAGSSDGETATENADGRVSKSENELKNVKENVESEDKEAVVRGEDDVKVGAWLNGTEVGGEEETE